MTLFTLAIHLDDRHAGINRHLKLARLLRKVADKLDVASASSGDIQDGPITPPIGHWLINEPERPFLRVRSAGDWASSERYSAKELMSYLGGATLGRWLERCEKDGMPGEVYDVSDDVIVYIG